MLWSGRHEIWVVDKGMAAVGGKLGAVTKAEQAKNEASENSEQQQQRAILSVSKNYMRPH